MAKKKDLGSEAAVSEAIRGWTHVSLTKGKKATILIYDDLGVIAEIDLREFITKRQPLTGIKKQVSKIVQGKRKKAR
jgi:hypothetical protein